MILEQGHAQNYTNKMKIQDQELIISDQVSLKRKLNKNQVKRAQYKEVQQKRVNWRLQDLGHITPIS